MRMLPFDAPVSLWKLVADHLGTLRTIRQEGEWSLGEAISHVISQEVEEQWRFEILSGNLALDHVDVMRMASTSIFRSWNRD